MASPKIRLDALLSRYGYCSRKEAAAWVKAGRITLNGEKFKSASDKAAPDEVLVEGEPVEFPHGLFIAYHKPAGCTCSHDEREGALVYDLLPPRWSRRNPSVSTIGRLDKDTSGLILLTDNGTLVHRLSSPKHHVEKVYEFTTTADIPADSTDLFASGGYMLEGERTPLKPARLEIQSPRSGRLILTEGRYHQVRRMMESQGAPVATLHRSAIGPVTLDSLGLEEGDWIEISPALFA